MTSVKNSSFKLCSETTSLIYSMVNFDWKWFSYNIKNHNCSPFSETEIWINLKPFFFSSAVSYLCRIVLGHSWCVTGRNYLPRDSSRYFRHFRSFCSLCRKYSKYFNIQFDSTQDFIKKTGSLLRISVYLLVIWIATCWRTYTWISTSFIMTGSVVFA